MGKQAKLKKIKKLIQQDVSSLSPTPTDPDRFVEHLEKQGYSLKRIQHAPEIPTQKREPQV